MKFLSDAQLPPSLKQLFIGNDTIVSTPLTWKRTPPCLKIHKPGSFPI